MPSLGLNFVLRMDGFAWLFAGLVTGIGALVVLYARYYMSPEDPVPRFFAFLLAFMGSMTGMVLSGNLVQLVFFWELTSLFSFLLIGYWHQTPAARDGARMALTVTAAGGLCAVRRRAGAGPHRRQLRPRPGAGVGRPHPVASALPAGARPHPSRRPDQERAVSVPLLAAACHGGPDPGVRLPAFGDAGEGRRIPAGAPMAGAGGHRRLVLDRRHGRHGHAAARCLRRDLPARPEGPAGLLHHQPSRADHVAARASTASWPWSRRSSTSSTTRPSRRRCSWRPASSTTRRARATSGASPA